MADEFGGVPVEGGDEFGGIPVGTEPEPKKGGVLRNLRAGATEGAVGIASALPETIDTLMHPIEHAIRLGKTLLGHPQVEPYDPALASRAYNEQLGRVGLNPEDVGEDGPADRIARMTGMGASAVLFPAAGAEEVGAAATGRLATMGRQMGRQARQGATGAAAGAAGAVAAEGVPDDHPLLKTAAEIAGTLVGAIAADSPGAVKDVVKPLVRRIAQPLTTEGQSDIAAETLRDRSSNPSALLADLQRDHPVLVPGSQPTTGELSGDEGVLSLQREQATKNPELFTKRRADQNAARIEALTSIQGGSSPEAVGNFLRGQFRDFDDQAQQNIDALTAGAQQQAEQLGGAGHPEQHGAALRGALQEAENTARTSERSLWRSVDPDNNIRVDASPTFQTAADIQGGMSRFAAPMEGDEKGIFDSIAGSKQLSLGELSDLRSRVSTAARKELISSGNSPAYARLIRLRGAIQNNLSDAATNQATQEAAAVARGEMVPEETIQGKLQGWVDAYYGQKKAAQSGTASGESPGRGAAAGPASTRGADGARLSPQGGSRGPAGAQAVPNLTGPLKDIRPPKENLATVLDSNFNNGRVVGDEIVPIETLTGGTSKSTTEGARVDNLAKQMSGPTGYFERLIADQDGNVVEGQHRLDAAKKLGLTHVPIKRVQDLEAGLPIKEMRAAINAAGMKNSTQVNQLIGHIATAYAEQGSAEAVRKEFEAPRGFEKGWDAALSAIEKGEGPAPPRPITEDDAAKLTAATRATRERAGTFGRGPVQQTLAKAGTQDVYKLPEAKVPEKFFHPGPTSFSDIQELRRVIGDEPANTILTDYATASMRRAAEGPDGVLDPRRVAAWQTRHAEAMRAFPELAQRFATVAGAADAIADATAARAAAIRERNATALAKVATKGETAEDVVKTVGGILGSSTAQRDMASLVRATAGNKAAREGLRQAVAEHITKNFISNTEGGTSGMGLMKSDAFQSFVEKNRGALAQVLSPEEMTTLDNIAADLRRANRSITAVKLPGGSNTAQDIHGIIKNDKNMSLLDKILSNAAVIGAGHMVGGFASTLTGLIGVNALNAARSAGFKNADELVTKALLDPVLAQNLLRRAPPKMGASQSAMLAARLRRIGAAVSAVQLGKMQ